MALNGSRWDKTIRELTDWGETGVSPQLFLVVYLLGIST